VNVLESVWVALDTLRANKLRSFLTMLGVIIGVMAVVVMVAMIEGARANVVKEFEKLGSDLIIIVFDPSERMKRGNQGGTVEGLDMQDLEAIRKLEGLRLVSADRELGSKELVYRAEKLSVPLSGTDESYLQVRNMEIAQGRYFTTEEVERGDKVVVVGFETAEKLFGKGKVPIGEDVVLDGTLVRVIGVLKKKGSSFGNNPDAAVYIPLNAALSRWAGDRKVSSILAVPHTRDLTNRAMDSVWEYLMRRYDNQADFKVDTLQSILRAIGVVLNVFGVLLGGIAGLALLVGGIGIMNIMLVSVTERTREIGLRKAMGAQRFHIMIQFLIESATLATIGGLIGMGLGWLIGEGVELATKQIDMFKPDGIVFFFPLWAGIGSFLFSAGVGIVFGIYPAWRAAGLDPIVALRHE
jgi:putative ABC transport system permease protein